MPKPFFLIAALLGMIFCSAPLRAQEVQGSIRFLEDSIALGRPVEVEMTLVHPEKTVVVFPDSNDDFKNWEIASSRYEATRTENGISTDKRIYSLRSFSIDTLQYIEAPYYFLSGKDTVLRFTGRDSARFMPRITSAPDSLKFRSFEGLTDIGDPPDYLMIGIAGAIALLVLALLVIMLRKPVLKVIRDWRIQKEWKHVMEKLREASAKLERQELFVGELNHIWKSYLDPGKNFSLASLSTTELLPVIRQFEQLNADEKQKLEEIARLSDIVQYAGQKMDETQLRAIPDALLKVLEKEYQRRREGKA